MGNKAKSLGAACPAHPGEVSPAWLTEALHGVAPGARVRGFEADQIAVGVGILGLLWRLTLRYEPAGAGPATAILKLPQTHPDPRHLADAFRFYLREIRFYEEVAGDTPVGTPDVYASAYDPVSGDFVLLLEDLGGRTVLDQLSGCPADRARTVVRALAMHHAAWWGDAELAARDWTFRLADPPNPQALVPALRASWPVIEANFAHVLRGDTFEFAKHLDEVVVPLMERLSQPPVTLLHGDSRLDNIFFSSDPAEPPVTFVDWQLCGLGRGPYDVAYFLSQSMLPEERKQHEEQLLETYHRTLVANGVEGYSLEDCWEDYRLAILFVSAYPLNAGSVDLVNERAVGLFTTMLDRSVSAIIDLDALELLPHGGVSGVTPM